MKQILGDYNKSKQPRKIWLNLISDEDFRNDSEQINMILELIMTRVEENILILKKELPKLGYVFEKNTNINSSNDDSIKELCSFISQFGYLPSSFIKFLEIPNNVNLNGHFTEWKDKKNFPHLDPIVIYPPNEILSYAKWWVESDSTIFIGKDNKSYVWFSEDEYTKDKVSGGGGYGIYIANETKIDNTVANYGIDINFLDYLRLCFKWAGFPNLHWFQDELKDDKLFQEIKKIGSKLNNF